MAELVSIIGRIRRLRRPGGGTPEHPIAPPEEPVDPGYGVDVGGPELPEELPDPPPGIWPPPSISHPIVPIPPPATGTPTPPIALPPGMIWPSPGKPEHPIAMPPAKFAVLVYIPGHGFKYVVVDPSLKPTPVK